MRHDTFDLAAGIARLRWADTYDDVLEQYPYAVVTTKDRLTIPRFIRLATRVSLTAEICFDQAQISEVVLDPAIHARIGCWTAEREATLARLARWTGIGSFVAGTSRLGATSIEFERDWSDFRIVLRHDPAALFDAASPASRVARVAQEA